MELDAREEEAVSLDDDSRSEPDGPDEVFLINARLALGGRPQRFHAPQGGCFFCWGKGAPMEIPESKMIAYIEIGSG
eukprot:1952250-Pyramimonas_sp.AAC.1